MYPRNAELLAALAEAETRAHTPSRLRADLAAAAAAAPSPFTWLLALRCEALRAAATLRLQVSIMSFSNTKWSGSRTQAKVACAASGGDATCAGEHQVDP
jgi:hypothetical protein